jgi:glycerol kinase
MYVAAIDQGTTGTRTMVFDRSGRVQGEAYETHEQFYPEPGWVEHDPDDIYERARETLAAALADADAGAADLAALGVTNQRETTLLWEADTGEPVDRAIVWQDRRTTDRVEALEREGKSGWIRERTGLEPDAYFSATKLEWLLDEHDPDRERAAAGDILFGTVDAWLIWNLTDAHVTDVTNASRTMLFDVRDLSWDDELLDEFDVPRACLPEVRPSSDESVYGRTDPDGFLGAAVPVSAALGDQQAALFGQTCFDSGQAKNTYGTGSFVLCNTGPEPVESDHGLLTTVGFQRSGEPVQYALEGSIFVTGAAIEWLEDVSLVEEAAETEELARSVDDTDGVYVVPAFSGLGAPHWDGRARGTVVGLTRGTRREHLVRATIEAIGYRTRDVVDAMEADADLDIESLRVDGGAVENDFLCEFQADVLDATVLRPAVDETTALGAAYAAGLATGYWADLEELREHWRVDRRFEPGDADAADQKYARWDDAVDRARDWARD